MTQASSLINAESCQSEPKANLIESIQAKEGEQLATVSQVHTWEDLRGLTWIMFDID